jgi:ABC-type multidrug transport system fused ATPase/permease subunit
MRTILGMVVRYPRLLAFSIILSFVAAAVIAPAPYLGKIIIDDIIFRQMGSQGQNAVSGAFGVPVVVWMLLAVVVLGVALKVLAVIIQGWQSWFVMRICRNGVYEMRLATVERLAGAPQRFFDTFEPGKATSRINQDGSLVDNAIIICLRFLVSAVFTVVLVMAFMLWINPLLTGIVLLTMPVTAALCWYSNVKMRAYHREESDRNANLASTTNEFLGAMRVARAFSAEPWFLRRVQARCEAIRHDGIRFWATSHTINAFIGLLSNLGADIFLLVGGVMAIYGHITFGEFFAFFGYQAMLWGPLNTLLNAGQSLQAGVAGAEKLHELRTVEVEPWLARPTSSIPSGPFRGEVRAERLGFAYQDGDPVLREVDLHLPAGTMTALVGQSGSGKTTFASLLMGLYLPTSGRLLIDGVEIRDWDLRELRRHLGVVLQDGVVFNDTVRANLCLGAEHGDEAIWAALRAAHLEEVIRGMPQGLDSPLGVHGVRLSGGQRQRLAIARVFLKNPRFVILDEATSALDSETEKAIQRSFEALLAGRTSVVIAHRLSTIVHADQIVVLHQGRVAEVGSHGELSERPDGQYRRLLEAQLQGMLPMSGVHRRIRGG